MRFMNKTPYQSIWNIPPKLYYISLMCQFCSDWISWGNSIGTEISHFSFFSFWSKSIVFVCDLYGMIKRKPSLVILKRKKGSFYCLVIISPFDNHQQLLRALNDECRRRRRKKIFVWHFWSERKKFWDASYQEGNKTEAFTRLDSDEPVKKTLLILEMKTSELRETGHLYKCVHCHPWNTKEKSLHTKREEQLDW